MLRTFAILIVLVAFLPPTAASEEVSAPVDSNAQSGNADSGRNPSIPIEVPAAISGPEQSNEHATEVDKSSLADWAMAALSALMLVAVGFQIWIARTQSGIVKSQLTEARQKNRAYVGVKSTGIGKPTIGKPVDITLEILNSGGTPAMGAMVRVAVVYGEYDTIDFSAKKLKTDAIFSLLPGDSGPVVEASPVITKQMLADMNGDGTKTLYIYGDINYRDVFQIRRSTTFRFRVNHARHVHGLALCRSGNEIE